MSKPDDRRSRWARLMNLWHARRSARARIVTGFVSQPEPRSVGSLARGRQLMAGNLQFAGHLVETDQTVIWDVPSPDAAFEEEIHGFLWLDDLAAAGGAEARALAQQWVWGWIDRYGRGRGPGWTPEQAGRRLIRLIQHALFLLRGRDAAQQAAFFQMLGAQTLFLGQRWKATPPGLARFEALAGLVYAGLSLTGMEPHVDPALAALTEEASTQIDAQGGLPTRNPEELLEVLTLLTWVCAALRELHRSPDARLQGAIARIVPTLRALRHADGGLARFHGGTRGQDGRVEGALAAAEVRARPLDRLAMGFARLSGGRTTLILDAAPPPVGPASLNAHASTLAFELTSGRRPVVVNCGSGAYFGEDWRRAGRATPSHSTLILDGYSSARLGPPGHVGAARREMLEDGPRHVPVDMVHGMEATHFEGAHDGYVATHGLTHARILDLAPDGHELAGEDLLLALEPAHEARFDARIDASAMQGVPFALRFHLHPDVTAEQEMGGAAVSMMLRSREVWVFRHDGAAELTLEPSVYLEKGRLRPRATKQIVLSGRALDYATRLRWTLSKAQEGSAATRDLTLDDDDRLF